MNVLSVYLIVLLQECVSSRLAVTKVPACVLKRKCGACVCIHACSELIPSVCVEACVLLIVSVCEIKWS